MRERQPSTGQPPAVISIIVPVYNVEAFLPRCVDSILAQSYPHLEVILVNDGSPDGSPAICDGYAARDSRVKVIHQENGGLSAARNAGIQRATGHYLGFVDGDDHLHPQMYEWLLQALTQAQADLAVCNYRLVDTQDRALPGSADTPIQDEVLEGQEAILTPLSQDGNWYWVVACTKLYPRRLFDGLRFPVDKLHEDEFVIHHLLLRCQRVACVSQALYNYVQHGQGITRSTFSLRRLDAAEAQFQRAALFHQEGLKPQMAYYACAVGLRVMSNGYQKLDMSQQDYRRRYRQLAKQFRLAARPLLVTRLPLMKKARLALNMLSPYYAWKLLERGMRAAQEEQTAATPGSTNP